MLFPGNDSINYHTQMSCTPIYNFRKMDFVMFVNPKIGAIIDVCLLIHFKARFQGANAFYKMFASHIVRNNSSRLNAHF